MPIKNCFELHGMPELHAKYEAKIKDGMTDHEMRMAGAEVVEEHLNKLNDSLNKLKKEAGKVKEAPKKIVKKEVAEKIEKEHQEKIEKVAKETEAAKADDIAMVKDAAEKSWPSFKTKYPESTREQYFDLRGRHKEAGYDKLTEQKPVKVGGEDNTVDQYVSKAKAVLEQLFPDHTIKLHEKSEDYTREEKRPEGSAGVFHPDTKTIALNLEAIRKAGAENTVFHEVIHPIVREALEHDSEVLKDAYDKIQELSKDPELKGVFEHENMYADRSIYVQRVEAVTEFLTKVADGSIDPSKVKKDLSTKIVELINKVLKAIGVNKQFSTASDLRVLADNIKTAFETADATALKESLGRVEGKKGGPSLDKLIDEDEAKLRATIKKFSNWSKEEFEAKLEQAGAFGKDFTKEEFGKIFDEVRGEEPPKPPKEKEVDEKPFENNVKSILSRISDSKNISEQTREKLKGNLKYEPQSHFESRKIAKDIISEFGEESALQMAESGRLGGGVNSMIFAEAIDNSFNRETGAKTAQEKIKYAEEWADRAMRYDEVSREAGRHISAINDFYKRSPLGILFKERATRDAEFNKWIQGKEKNIKEVWEAIKEEPEFKELFSKEVESKLKEERAEFRAKRRKLIEDTFDKLKIKTDGLNSSILPPQIWNGAVELIKQLALAGESAANAIQKGVEYINENHNEAWDDKDFRDKMKDAIRRVDSVSSKVEKTPEEKAKNFLERFGKKLKGLSESQKDQIITKSFKKLIENGALDHDEFKKIIAESMGLGEMKPEEKAKIVELVKNINDVQDKADAVTKAETDEDIKKAMSEFDKASKLAEKSATELGGMVYNKVDIGQRIRSLTQLNTLGFVSLLKNPMYNVFQTAIRLPRNMIVSLLDGGIYGASLLGNKAFKSPIIKPDTNIALSQMGYFKEGAKGAKVAVEQVFTGLTNKDYFQKEVRSSQIKPLDSWKDIYSHVRGEKHFTGKQIFDKVLQGTLGFPAEFVARMLNIGDKPFRFAAEGAKSEQIGRSEFGLSGSKLDRFMRFPKEVAKSEFIKKGLTEEEASKKAEEIERIIVKHGEESVAQQSNWLSDKLAQLKTNTKQQAEGNPGYVFADAMGRYFGMLNAPFVKTPLNIGWEVFNLVNPEIALAQSFAYGVKAFKTGSREARIESKKWFAHAAVGLALGGMAKYLASNGVVQGNDDAETYNQKEVKSKEYYTRPNSLNLTKLGRLMRGEALETQSGDLMVDLSWFGSIGTLLNLHANKIENDKTKGVEDNGYLADMAERMRESALTSMVNNVFGNTISGLDALKSGKWENYARGLANTGINLFQPATFAQWGRASLPYDYQIKGDTFFETMKNNWAARSPLFRKLSGEAPPPKITIWGDVAGRGTGFKDQVFNYLGWDEVNKDIFAAQLFEDFERTGNRGFFPSVPQNKFTVKGEEVKLSQEEHEKLQMLVGQARRNLVSPFLSGAATMEIELSGDKEKKVHKYSELDNDKDKIKCLEKLYDDGLDDGKKQFLKLYRPELTEQ